MSYQVLARKWRPKTFQEMVGQSHVLKALVSALDNQRLHHAYLFTGTRGVGKTTIARIMAKCLNCEQGVSSTPCGVCSICKEVDEGRFVDLIEVDAASKTKVEDTRELLENVQYMPSRGRYKVYLIDEVHMLSTSSFNALLKTLEEPPSYVKFLLATTDPQKLPPTVLSRCLQFSLKNMQPEPIVGHLEQVLTAESIPFESDALWLLGRAADGSMRDAMSLTDQAIAFGNGQVKAEDVRAMLGTIDHAQVFTVLQALLAGDGKAVLQAIAHLADQGPDWTNVLNELLAVLHRAAIAQLMPDTVDNGQGDREQVLAIAQAVAAEDIQFFYQVGLIGQRDLTLAPDGRTGFEMVLLRMLAFRPATVDSSPKTPLLLPEESAEKKSPELDDASQLATVDNIIPPWEEPSVSEEPASLTQAAVVVESEPEDELSDEEQPSDFAEYYYSVDTQEADTHTPTQQAESLKPHIPEATGLAAEWIKLYPTLKVTGMAANIASHCTLVEQTDARWLLHLSAENSAVYNENYRQRINVAINEHLGRAVQLDIEVHAFEIETPALFKIRTLAKQQLQAEIEIKNDPIVLQLIDRFGVTIDPETINSTIN